jgi:hypothetical protein
LIVNYQLPGAFGGVVRAILGKVAGRGNNPWAAEPWLSTWSPRDMARLLALHGFAVRDDRDLLTIATTLGIPLGQRFSLRNSHVAVAER